jgi:antitoxin YefM
MGDRTVSYSAFRESLADYMDQVVENRTELHVTRQGSPSVVVLAEDEFASIQETLHLVRSAANARRLFDAMADVDAGKLTEFDPTTR